MYKKWTSWAGTSTLSSWQFQLRPRHRGIVGHATGRVTEIVDHKGEVGHSPEGGGGKFEQDLKGGTVRVDYKGETTKSGYLNFDPGEMSTIKWRPTGGHV